MTTVSLKLPDALAAELAAAAAKRRVSKATLARELLSASLAPARPKLSAYEVMQAGCGVVTDAPHDLRAKDDPAENDSEELAELLLCAVRGPHRPVKRQDFDELRQRARRKPTRA